MTKLRLADNLSLPLDVVTQTIAILAKRRAGKSYTMRRLIEQLFKAGQQIVIVDPKGDQWGIRSAADGKAPGLSIVILGGERGDVRLEPNSGEVVAKLVVEERVSVLLDLSPFRKSEVATFMTAFLENLYRLKAREIYRTPMMLVIDEADAIAPQKPQHGEERMLGAAEDIVRRGGQRGIGCILVSQRSAVLNKNVLTQAQVLVALRTIAPQDLSAMKAWIDVHGTQEQCKTLMASLPSLPIGDAWFWSPGWPTTDGIFKRVHILPIETFDSGATPKPGMKPVAPKQVADVDLDALKRQMSATIEKAKAEDPKELRRKIAELQRELQQAHTVATPKAEVQIKEVPVFKGKQLAQLDTFCTKLTREAERHGHAASIFWSNLNQVAESLLKAIKSTVQERPPAHPVTQTPRMATRILSVKSTRDSGDVTTISRSRQRILNALVWAEGIGLAEMDKTQLAIMSDARPTSGGYFNNLGSLRSAGLIAYPKAGTVSLTAIGRAQAEPVDVPTTSEALHQMLYGKLPTAQSCILKSLIECYPHPISKEILAEQSGQRPTSGGYFNNLGRLRSLKLIDYPSPGLVVAQPILFLN